MPPYIGEVRLFAGAFTPRGFLPCDGRELSAAEYPGLGRALGAAFGGDGRASFALPDLRGRVPVHVGQDPDGNSYRLGDKRGAETVVLAPEEIDGHSHPLLATTAFANASSPAGNVLAQFGVAGVNVFSPLPPNAGLSPLSLSTAPGGSGPHDNLQPFLCLHFIIAVAGEDPRAASASGEPLIGEVRLFPYDFAPDGWASCNGSELPIAQGSALFAVLGTTWGGDGRSSFALPDLRDRIAMGAGEAPGLARRRLGETGGAETVVLAEEDIPPHSHALPAVDSLGTAGMPAPGLTLARSRGALLYKTDAGEQDMLEMAADAIGPAGAGQAHPNMMPYLALNYCVAIHGVEPRRN